MKKHVIAIVVVLLSAIPGGRDVFAFALPAIRDGGSGCKPRDESAIVFSELVERRCA